ncbi:MAG TPA: OmpH family outer membrane protein [Trueperaceae bacterium]|nr:OmpH family outer membrane protein [Trueperaceae bacterium]
MRRLTLFGLAAAVVIGFLASSLSAQERETRLVFVDSQAALLAHPSGATIQDLQQRAETEVNDLVASLTALDQRLAAGETLSAADNERYQALQTSLSAVQTRYRDEIAAAAEPAVAAVNAIIKQLAEENGYTVVMDRVEAANLRLVVYADDDLDITPVVIERLAAQ